MIPQSPISSPAAWRGSEQQKGSDWIYVLSSDEKGELDAAIRVRMPGRPLLITAALLVLALICTTASSQEHVGSGHDAGMNERGEHVMGFSQSLTTHHFLLTQDGGVIQVEANDPGDTTSRDEIREHLTHIAQMFSEGDFNAPMLIHAQTPPGVPEMKRLKGKISYKFEQTNRGGLVRISTSDPQAVSDVHAFLRFQIREHQTGDPLTVSN